MKSKFFQLSLLSGLFLISLVACTKYYTDTDEEETTGSFVDSRDQKTYEWKKIGDQIWMTENLAYKVSEGCWAYNNDESNALIYGYLYDWDVAQTVAPQGWHLPSQDEWETLVDYLGGQSEAYEKLLESGTVHWESPNSGNNESGFTALPSGYYDQRDLSFNYLGHLTMFHSTTEHPTSPTMAFGLILNPNYPNSIIEGRPKELALPIRCVKD